MKESQKKERKKKEETGKSHRPKDAIGKAEEESRRDRRERDPVTSVMLANVSAASDFD
jgi:hypothetical protein